ncbi:glycosyltransferase involved in cell wall biosynthesis [Roseibium hamelinense]|uniref:Glycosyltransferase involved in cell wall biosynthesis n=1 Tax=Roseibium hamelinense TaxID=150831 RepID=A0A562T9L1_9HYPH|nr:glycosyltransferase family 4 protein [Roseibium hamelinense]MTI42824.1 glycosyltransferase family 1 protein [Roseibium hamelinense]TWI89490.1 glycosyltransferase involved in cell wall biosynthesis [Roseibium hamelinense]
MNILWKVGVLSMRVASVRLRTLLPALSLARSGFKVTVSDRSENEDALHNIDALIINKSFRDEDIGLARAARQRGIPVVYDLCDYVYALDYGDGSGREGGQVTDMLQHCSAFVTTGPALGEAIVAASGFDGQVYYIPDSEEPKSDVETLTAYWIEPGASTAVAGLTFSSAALLTPEKHIFPKSDLRLAADAIFKRDGWLRPDRKTVFWFGTPGKAGSNTGLYALRMVKDAVEKVGRDIPLQMLVVSSSRKLFRDYSRDYAVPCVFRPWTLMSMYDHFARADVTVIPNPKDSFSIVKSANRAIFSLSCETPVIADPVPSLDEFAGCTQQDGWERGLRAYLSDPQKAASDVAEAKRIIAGSYSLNAIRDRWIEALETVAK